MIPQHQYPGAEPPDLTEEQEAELAREEYFMTHGYCPVCNGEFGEGWSTCTCVREPDEQGK